MPHQQSPKLDSIGIGLRAPHYQHILEHLPPIPWFEVLIDNYMNEGGLPLKYLEDIRHHYPMTFHGVGMSLGALDPLNDDYLKRLKHLIDRYQPTHVSDHLCWSGHAGLNSNDLLPIPYTEEAIQHVVNRIDQVQEFLGQRILIENVSSYLSYQGNEMNEQEFLCEVVKRSDCFLLCDVNNIYVSASNHNFDPLDYIALLPKERIKEMHLAGYEEQESFLLDTHGKAVHEPVWHLYEQAVEQLGKVPTLIEWDTNIPDFDTLWNEQKKAEQIWAESRERQAL